MNKTLYRKYIPNNFKEIIGQSYIKKILLNSLNNNMLTHAYIFSGPRGVGKTSMSKIFSKAINCLNRDNGDACSKCNNCLLFNSGECMDVLELDAASNNGVGEIRNLIESTKFIPNVFNIKIYIIDEVHMLTNNSWNALLKTLEDPPKNVIFIFATTEVNKIPLTIISRCQRFDFEKISNDNLKEFIDRIVRLENIKINNEAINEIITISDGSVRDCLSILNQTISFSNNLITDNDVREIFGLINISKKIDLIKLLINCNIYDVSKIIKEYELKGINFYKLTYELIEMFLDKLLYLKSNSFDNLKILNKNNINNFKMSENDLLKIIEILQNGIIQIKSNIDDRLFFELIMLNCISYLSKNKTANINEEKMDNNNYINNNASKEELDNSINDKMEEISPRIISNKNDNIDFKGMNVKFEDIVISRKLEKEEKVHVNNINNIQKDPYTLREVKFNFNNVNTTPVTNDVKKEINDFHLDENEDLILLELNKNIMKNFSEIAFNNDNEIKHKLNNIFDSFKKKIPRTPEEGYIIGALKILVASKNGLVFMFDDELSAMNLNLISDNEEFIIYIKNNFGSIYKVIGVSREEAKKFSELVKDLKKNHKVYPDVNIEKIKLKIKNNATTKEIALEIFGDELGR